MKKTILSIGVALFAAVTNAQTTNINPANFTLGGFLSTALGLRDPAIQPYGGKAQFQLIEGVSYGSKRGDMEQSSTALFWWQLTPSTALGASGELNTLGGLNTDISGVSIDLNYRYSADNLAVIGILGYRKDVVDQTRNIEAGIGLEYHLSKYVGTAVRYLIEVNPGAASGRRLDRRLVVGASVIF